MVHYSILKQVDLLDTAYFNANTGKSYCFKNANDRITLTPQSKDVSHTCNGVDKKCPECQGECNPDVPFLKDDNCEGNLLCYTENNLDIAVTGCSNVLPDRPQGT